MQRTKYLLFVVLLFLPVLSACGAQPIQSLPTVAPTKVIDSGRGITSGEIDPPLSEAEVPRISLEGAKAALDNGTAILVDVRSPGAFEASHVAGAISIPLGEIERNPLDLAIDENQWIITYCT